MKRIALSAAKHLRARVGTRPSSDARSVGTRLSSEAGFTLIEVLIATVVLTIGLVGLLGLLNTSVKASSQTRAREGATNIARQILEDARSISFAQVSPTSLTGQLQAMSGLANEGSGSTWELKRRNFLYTITVSECSIDDPKDGLGKHDSTFCAGQAEGTEKGDAQPIDLKRVTVDVKWAALGRSPVVHEVLMLTSAGEAVGLSASELKLTSPVVSVPTEPVITTAPEELTFTVNSPAGTTAMIWTLNGTTQSPAPTLKEGTTWTFKWKVASLSDGIYQVSAQAVNSIGVVGSPVTIPVRLIRNVPVAPKGISAGFNEVYVSGSLQKVVELRWEANSELNIIGYRVHRPNATLTCPSEEGTLSLTLSCIDLAPPAAAAGLVYQIAALYRDSSNVVREGTQAKVTLTYPLPKAPTAATNLTGVKNANGSVTLTWTAPSSGAPTYYRVYRESTNYTSRYEIVAGTTTTFTDTDAITAHGYWVSAVGPTLVESPLVGPVTQ